MLPFFLALHWEYVGSFLDVNFSLKASHLGSLDPHSTIVLGAAVLGIVALLVLHLVWAWQEGIHYPYVAALVGIPLLIGTSSLLLGDGYHIHVHHYCLGAFLFPFFRFRKLTSMVSQGFFLGLAIEGISRWGMDPLWYYVR
ncbi:MAG: hypothetical protein P8J87_12480 [Verrucomicrobiales bacterium]|nr:hypothetical protein [Verrucomicrobiales bacterium]